jgi:opacity protein-like surface antigen
LTLPTPITALKVGAAFDMVSANNAQFNTVDGSFNPKNDSGWTAGVYATVQATDKLSFNLRGEYFDLEGADTYVQPNYAITDGRGEEVTATLQYNLWANVISRVEFRWDHIDSGNAFGNPDVNGLYSNGDSFLLAANLIYTF